MTTHTMKHLDHSSMHTLLVDFPKQVEDAVRIGTEAALKPLHHPPRSIVVTGLGGSAIGGDLLRSYLAEDLAMPFIVNRHYLLPEFVDRHSLVLVSSYSGNTEETIAAHRDAIRRKAQVVCLSSNGKTAELAAKHHQPLVTIPRGYPPRAALGYSFFAPLVLLLRLKLIRSRSRDILESISLLKKSAAQYAVPGPRNRALRIAQRLHGSVPVIYSSADRFDAVNLRWRGQIAENAKMLAFGHVLPEMNHNELVGWHFYRRTMKGMKVVFLRDRADHPRVKARMEITRHVVAHHAGDVLEVTSVGSSLLARMFSLIYLGDWVSFYLAMLNHVDPTPVKVIDMLKKKLERIS